MHLGAGNNHLVLAVGDRPGHDAHGLGMVLETKGNGATVTVIIDSGSAGKVPLMLIGDVLMIKLCRGRGHGRPEFTATGGARPG